MIALSLDIFRQVPGTFVCQQPEHKTPLWRTTQVSTCQPEVFLPSPPVHLQVILTKPEKKVVLEHTHYHRREGPGTGRPELLFQWLCKHVFLHHVAVQQDHPGHQQALRLQQLLQ